MGIEPTRPAWKAGILPLNYTRKSATRYIIHNLKTFVKRFLKKIYKENLENLISIFCEAKLLHSAFLLYISLPKMSRVNFKNWQINFIID